MNTPSPNDLFMNVWVSKINSEDFPQPGDDSWDSRKMLKYWLKVWLDCKELGSRIQEFENAVEKTKNISVIDEKIPAEGIEID